MSQHFNTSIFLLAHSPPPRPTGGDVFVRKWDSFLESVVEIEEEEAERVAAGVKRFEFDQWLGVYPGGEKGKREWEKLVGWVDPWVLGKCQSVSRVLYSDAILEVCLFSHFSIFIYFFIIFLFFQFFFSFFSHSHLVPSHPNQPLQEMKKKKIPNYNKETNLFFTDIPSSKLPPSPTPSQITQYSLDKSYLLSFLLEKEYSGEGEGGGEKGEERLVGELQFAFVVFLLGQRYEGFEQVFFSFEFVFIPF